MRGEKDCSQIIQKMSPSLQAQRYVFCTIQDAKYGDFAHCHPIGSFIEREGLTLILEEEKAQKEEFSYEGVFQCITLNVHSSLHAVGLTAAVSTALARHNISANMMAGYFHDHIFVSSEQANDALRILRTMSEQKKLDSL